MITAYIAFNGNTEEAFNLYKSVLGGEFDSLQRFGDTPQGEEMAPADKNKIMHISLKGPGGLHLMGNDHVENMGPFIPGNNFSLSLLPGKKEEADRLFNGLSEGGEVIMPMQETFWGAYFGMFTDRFGVRWMVNHELNG